jgi:hypothetical protein
MLLNVLPATTPFAVTLMGLYLFNQRHLLDNFKKNQFNLIFIGTGVFIITLIVGVLVGIGMGNNFYDIGKDGYFNAKAIIYILFGVTLYKAIGWNAFSNIVIRTGFIAAVIYLAVMLINLLTGAISFSLYEYRKALPFTPYESAVALILTIFKRGQGDKRGLNKYLFISFMLFIVLSTLSRVLIGYVMLAFAAYLFAFGNKLFISFFALAMGIMITITISGGYVDANKDSEHMIDSMLYKASIAIDETTSSNFDDAQMINERWRAYESLMGVTKFLGSPLINQIFGNGFGANTDIQTTMLLGESERTDVPIFHNGYIYLLVKGGGFALLLYILLIMRLGHMALYKGKNTNLLVQTRMYRSSATFSFLLVLLLCLLTAVFFGPFNSAVFNNLLIVLFGAMANTIELRTPRIA